MHVVFPLPKIQMIHRTHLICLPVAVSASDFVPSVSQHQQQVVQAVERAKQVTMAELNAIIGVGVFHTHKHTHRVIEGTVWKIFQRDMLEKATKETQNF